MKHGRNEQHQDKRGFLLKYRVSIKKRGFNEKDECRWARRLEFLCKHSWCFCL